MKITTSNKFRRCVAINPWIEGEEENKTQTEIVQIINQMDLLH